MENDKRKIRQEKLIKMFYEMGMDIEVISKMCKVDVDKIKKLSDLKKSNAQIDIDKY